MVNRLGLFLILAIGLLGSPILRAETCASNSTALKSTPRLEALREFFGSDHIGLVNETEGSYVVIDLFKEKAAIAFYTSGLFDLTAIKRDGPVEFCDLGTSVVMRGLDREEILRLDHGRLVVGEGGPKKTFVKGAMPSKLVRLHGYRERSIASESK